MGKSKISIMHGLVNTEDKEIEKLDDLIEVVTNNVYSLANFKDNYRTKENFIETMYIGLDFDGGYKATDAIADFKEFAHIIATTKSHQIEKNGTVDDRFRVILELSQPITSKEDFEATYLSLITKYPKADKACKDPSRFFYKSKEILVCAPDGQKIQVVKAQTHSVNKRPMQPQPVFGVTTKPLMQSSVPGSLPLSKNSLLFLINGAISGERHPAIYKYARDCLQQQWTKEQCLEKLYQSPAVSQWLDDHALRQVDYVFDKTVPKHGPRIGPQDEEAATEKWVLEHIRSMNLACSYSRVIFKGAEIVSRQEVLRDLRILRDRQKMSLVYKNEQLEDYVDMWIATMRKNHLEAIKDEISGYDQDGGKMAEMFIKAVTGKVDTLALAALQQFIWLTKRKLFTKFTTHHLMIVLKGQQGSGKTVSINKLLSPLGELVAKPNGLTVIGDERQSRLFTDHFVCFFDEMSQADRADIETLKNRITSEIVEYRILGTNDRERGPNNSTFIGASNKALQDIIQDNTGARRFFEIESLDKCDWDMLNKIDYTLLWKCISEDADIPPITPHLAAIGALQEATIRHRTPLETYIFDSGEVEVVPVKDDTEFKAHADFMSSNELRLAFVEWYGQAVNQTWFGKMIKPIKGIYKLTSNVIKYNVKKASAVKESNGKGLKFRKEEEPY